MSQSRMSVFDRIREIRQSVVALSMLLDAPEHIKYLPDAEQAKAYHHVCQAIKSLGRAENTLV